MPPDEDKNHQANELPVTPGGLSINVSVILSGVLCVTGGSLWFSKPGNSRHGEVKDETVSHMPARLR
jgi:hypothetical protein